MHRRRKAREAALQVLYGLDMTKDSAEEAMALFWDMGAYAEDREDTVRYSRQVKPFATHLVLGTWQHRREIDHLIAQYSEHWSLGRISCVDRSILRLAIFEMLYCDDIPPKVSINEAIDLGKLYGTENSSAFINGILDALYNHLEKRDEKR
ncbi:MAG TPA: transcription antitermination factor NusB [Syntrophales bacterium]|nr:transcription antitermination factor NusB [Syntrophales bacterium]HOL58743.1 transcription antitermination factor NusB [Syntrophales bacterium]HPO34969.1 transcription antitermination factor NusB [Syntrophales bacterium]